MYLFDSSEPEQLINRGVKHLFASSLIYVSVRISPFSKGEDYLLFKSTLCHYRTDKDIGTEHKLVDYGCIAVIRIVVFERAQYRLTG